MTTASNDIAFLRDIAEDYDNGDDYETLRRIADRLEDIQTMMPLLIPYIDALIDEGLLDVSEDGRPIVVEQEEDFTPEAA